MFASSALRHTAGPNSHCLLCRRSRAGREDRFCSPVLTTCPGTYGVKLGQRVRLATCQVFPHPCPDVSAAMPADFIVRLPYVMGKPRPSVNVSGCTSPDQHPNRHYHHRHNPRRQSPPRTLAERLAPTNACTEITAPTQSPGEVAHKIGQPDKPRITTAICQPRMATSPTFCEDGDVFRELQHFRRHFRDLPEP